MNTDFSENSGKIGDLMGIQVEKFLVEKSSDLFSTIFFATSEIFSEVVSN